MSKDALVNPMLENALVWTCGGESTAWTFWDEDTNHTKYDMVFIIGPDLPGAVLLKNAAKESKLRICIIGDGGKESFLNKALLAKTLSGKIDANTSIHINGHGIATKNYKNGVYSEHEIKIYDKEENRKTSLLLRHLKVIFNNDRANTGIQPVIDLWSCHGGAAANNAPYGLKLTLHSGQKYETLVFSDSEAMVNAINAKTNERGEVNPYNSFMRSIVTSPETAIYKENGQFFKAAAPKAPLAGKELETHLREQLKKFLEFRSDKLGHVIDFYKSIEEQVAEFQISSDELTRYNELALIMESNRQNSENGLKYVDAYIKTGVDINATLLNGSTALNVACYGGNLEVAKLLLATEGADVNQPDNDGKTPLYLACENGHTEVAKLLIERGANIDAVEANGRTPLYKACVNGHTEVAGLLLARGANPDIMKHKFQLMSCFSSPRYNFNSEITELLIANKADVKRPDRNGATPLHIACQTGNAEVAKLLLARGADSNQPDKYGFRPSDIARQNHHTAVAELIDNNILEQSNRSNYSKAADEVAILGLSVSTANNINNGTGTGTAPVVGGRVSGCFGFGR